MPERPSSPAAYLARLPPAPRSALETLRDRILESAPDADERISYGIVVVRHEGRDLVGYGANSTGCVLYAMSSSTLDAVRQDLGGFRRARSCVYFSPTQPLPRRLIASIVRSRIQENRQRPTTTSKARSARRPPDEVVRTAAR